MTAPVEIQTDTAILHLKTRQRVEIEILALFAASPKAAGLVMAEYEVDLSWFTGEDHRAIAFAIDEECKRTGPVDVDRMGLRARQLLTHVSHWDQSDCREFITGALRWGPGSLSVLLAGMRYQEESLRASIRQLIRLMNAERAYVAVR